MIFWCEPWYKTLWSMNPIFFICSWVVEKHRFILYKNRKNPFLLEFFMAKLTSLRHLWHSDTSTALTWIFCGTFWHRFHECIILHACVMWYFAPGLFWMNFINCFGVILSTNFMNTRDFSSFYVILLVDVCNKAYPLGHQVYIF